MRYWPEVENVSLLGFAGYKVGMAHSFVLDEEPTSFNYGKEVYTPLTAIETPPIFICALRAYAQTSYGKKAAAEIWAQNLPKEIARILKPPPKNTDVGTASKGFEERIGKVAELRVVVATNPKASSTPRKKPEIMEIGIGGKTLQEKWSYAKGILGKWVEVSEIFQPGQYIDVIAVDKGKGFQGPVKRFGIRTLQKKSRKAVRAVGTIGAWHPAAVMYTVPRAGQMGFAQRVEFNKRILKVGKGGEGVNPKGGFLKYGVIKGPYLLLKGSIPGPVKRLVRLRLGVRSPGKIQLPKITFYSLVSQQET